MRPASLAVLVVLCIGILGGWRPAAAALLQQVRERGAVNCGVNTGLPGFSAADAQGNWSGLDVDYCRALASAIFNDPGKVKFTPLREQDRFAALQSGAVDVLARNVAWTARREGALGLIFTAVNYYDRQGLMVHASLNVRSALELNGASICVQKRASAERNLKNYFLSHRMTYKELSFGTRDEAVKAYDAGRCDVLTADISQLYSDREQLENPEKNVVLPDALSKAFLSPMVRQGDDQWLLIASWVQYAMVDAEELGVSKANVDISLKSQDERVKHLLGADGDIGKSLGLTKDWAYDIIRNVGNYGEVFDRNLGKNSKLGIARGLNRLWTKGGLMYAPPML